MRLGNNKLILCVQHLSKVCKLACCLFPKLTYYASSQEFQLMPYFSEHDRGRAMDFSGSNATRKQGSYFSRKYPHKFSQLICTSCADDLQPFLNAAPKTATTSSGWMGSGGYRRYTIPQGTPNQRGVHM